MPEFLSVLEAITRVTIMLYNNQPVREHRVVFPRLSTKTIEMLIRNKLKRLKNKSCQFIW